MGLEALRARLKELAGILKTLGDKSDLTAEDFEALTKANDEFEDVEKKITALERASTAAARAAAPAGAPAATAPAPTVPAFAGEKLTSAEKIGFMVVGMARAFRETGAKGAKATFDEMEKAGYGEVAREFQTAQRALNASSAAAGGLLVPEDVAGDVIDILRPRSTFLASNPRRVPFDNGNYRIPAAATGATAGWRGEGRRIEVSQPTFKDINLSAKFLDAMVPLTNQLIRWSRPDIKAWVERDMAAAIGTELDRAAYFGSGTVNEPLGLLNIPGVTTITATGTSNAPTVVQMEADAAAMELSMMSRNLPMDSAVWVMSPRTFVYLQDRRDGNGNRYYPELQAAEPRWRNRPVRFTTQFPVNGGVGTDESYIALINFDDVYLGESRALTFAVSTEASYVKNGQTVSAFQNDLTLIKASTEVDVDLRYLEAVAVLPAVKWGAAA